jgi:hypothetical protein
MKTYKHVTHYIVYSPSNTAKMSDSLVFYMCETDIDLNVSDMQTFVLYDFKSSSYLIYGHRKSHRKHKNRDSYEPFYFRANKLMDVSLFLYTLVDKTNRFTYALYAMNELPVNADDIKFEYLYDRIQTTRELVALDDQELNTSIIHTYSKLTRKIYSVYDIYDYSYDYDYDCDEESQEV